MSGILCSIAGATYAAAPAFVSPTAEFINDANTKLLLHFNGTNGDTTTTDDATNPRTAKTITARGNAQVSTAQSKFGGASMLSDGAGDCLQVSSNADFGYSTGDFTIEFFIRPTTNLTSTYNIWEQRADGEAGAVKPSIYISGSTLYYYTNSDNRISHSVTLASGTWYHIALSRSSGSTKMFLDGTQVGSTYTDSNSYATSQVVIGAYSTGGGGFTGSTPAYFEEIRVSNTARYTTTFTPTTAAFVNDANTVFLLHCDGTNASTTFTDDVGGRTAKTVTLTNSSLNTTTKKFGTASLSVDGTGADRATIPDSDDFDLQAAPRTFECWVYINSFTNISRNSPDHMPKLFGHFDPTSNIYWAFGPNTEQGLSFYYWSGGNEWVHSTKKDLVTGQWYHMALIVTSDGAKGYVDGVEYLSRTLSNTPVKSNTVFAIGAENSQSMNAYIDEVRVSHVNRYT